MACQVTVLADSVAPNGSRLITMEVEHWRAIHAEVLRHRSFSFSAASSRAIPGGRMIDYVQNHPASPVAWTTTKKGMQGGNALAGQDAAAADNIWRRANQAARYFAKGLDDLGVHKSISNRRLEADAHIRCVITTAEPGLINFLAQRLHWDAEPSMQVLAKRMAEAFKASTPRRLEAGEWHLPYVTEEDWSGMVLDDEREIRLARLSAARCARVSYKTHDGKTPTHAEDFDLFERLVGSDPKHASPTEHQAMAVKLIVDDPRNGNLGPGWVQHRKLIPGERATAETFDLDARMRLYEGVDYLLEDPTR